MYKKDLHNLMNGIINKLPANKCFGIDDYEELYTLNNLLGETTRWGKKCTPQTQYCVKYATNSKNYKYKCIHLKTPNTGALIPITKAKALQEFFPPQNKNSTKRSQVLAAMRSAINYQIDDFRIKRKQKLKQYYESNDKEAAWKESLCPITNKLLMGATHVDHYPKPFIQLADEWLVQEAGLDKFYKVPLVNRRGNRKDLAQPYLKSWQDYHLSKAKLRLVGATANVKQGSGEYKSKY